MADNKRHAREAEHWDRVALETSHGAATPLRVEPEDLHDRTKPWLPYLGLPALTRCALDSLGDLAGRRVLELGTGTGFLAAAMAHRGARVDAIDVSPHSIAAARETSRLSGVEDRITFHEMPCEDLGFPDHRFDAACGIFVLHHCDVASVSRELGRVLKPGACSAFVETMGYNPLLMFGREKLAGRRGIEKASTEDEAPISRQNIADIADNFPGTIDVIWPELVFIRMLSYVRLLQNRPCELVFGTLDRLAKRLPGTSSLSYFAVVTACRDIDRGG